MQRVWARQVAAKLELSEEEAEQWVVRAVTAGFLGARVDQMRRVVRAEGPPPVSHRSQWAADAGIGPERQLVRPFAPLPASGLRRLLRR